mgnify:CR=1 FL=1
MKLATPASELCKIEANLETIKSLTDCFEMRDCCLGLDIPNVELYHSDIQPIHPMLPDSLDKLIYVKKRWPELKVISLHVASNSPDVRLERGWYHLTKRALSEDEMIGHFKHNIQEIRDAIGTSVKLAIENNCYYPTAAYDTVTDPVFLTKLLSQSDVYFLLDYAHAQITAYNKKVSFQGYFKALPLDKLIQIHLSVPDLTGKVAADSHQSLSTESIMDFSGIIKKRNIEYVTVEYYQDIQILADILKELKTKLYDFI